MAAIVTDQFRIFNTSNFINSVDDTSNSYYVFLGLPNPTNVGFGRTSDWNTNTPNPIDNFDYENGYHDTMMFGKKITTLNTRRLIRRIDWAIGVKYEMYRHDYSINTQSPITKSSRLYDTNYYVINSDYRVYICIDNGSSGINPTGNASQDEPTFTDLEPSKAGESGDGYLWKYLFTVPPSDIIKFDSTEYITVPNNWNTSTDAQIAAVRENGDSTVNDNQIKKVYIESQGSGYNSGIGQVLNIQGDGSGGQVVVDVVSGKITNTQISSGGKGYSYGMVDLGSINSSANSAAKLIPIIPPSKGHGYDLYKELGADKILVYARFDDSTKDFPIDTKFSQIGIIKNPVSYGSNTIFTDNQYSSLYAIKFLTTNNSSISVGDKITQVITAGVTTGNAYGYVASYDSETKVLKYFKDRTAYFNSTYIDQTDYIGISTGSKVLDFQTSTTTTINPVTTSGGFSGTIDTGFTGITTNPNGNKVISLGVQFNYGLATPEINKGSGDIIYIDNRPLVSRNSRQKEDVKIILEF
jgi:hypothetical protein